MTNNNNAFWFTLIKKCPGLSCSDVGAGVSSVVDLEHASVGWPLSDNDCFLIPFVSAWLCFRYSLCQSHGF